MKPATHASHRSGWAAGLAGWATAPVAGQLLRYLVNCGQILVLKLVLVVVLTAWLAPAIAYLIVHVITFFASYAIHVRSTFRTEPGSRSLLGYLATVIGFKAFDWALFNLLVTWNIAVTASVLGASALEAIVRFVVVRRVLGSTAPHEAAGIEPGRDSTTPPAVQVDQSC